MKKISLYYRDDSTDAGLEMFKYCPGIPKKYLTGEFYVLPMNNPSALFGLFGDPFDNIFKDKDENDENYYFPLCVSLTNLEYIVKEIDIPQQVIQDIFNKKCKILVFNSYEGWEWKWWKNFVNPLFEKYNLELNDFVFVNANLADSEDCNSIYNNFWERQAQQEDMKWLLTKGNMEISNNIIRDKKYICLNRRPHAGRFVGVTELYRYIDDGYLSFGKNGQMHDQYFVDQENIFSKHYPKSFKRYKKFGLQPKIPLTIDDGVDPEAENPVHDWAIEKFYQSYLHICPETYQYRVADRIFFSEKIFKPMMYMQPFVILGEQHALKALKKLGYKTFDTVLDESYDSIENDQERLLKACRSAIEYFNRSKEDLMEDMHKITSILNHNLSWLSYRSLSMDSNLHTDLEKKLYE